MRTLLALTLFAAACTSNPPEGAETYDSVRDRMASTKGAQLYIGHDGSTGSITARRWTPTGWVEGVTPVAIESGELAAKLDSKGQLTVEKFMVALAPIEIPEEVFKKPAQLHDVRVSLPAPTTAAVTWSGDNDATGQITVALDFDWSIAVNDGRTPLATQHLPPITVDFMFTGAGDHIDASASLHAMGELWNWAGLLEMTSMKLDVSAATTD